MMPKLPVFEMYRGTIQHKGLHIFNTFNMISFNINIRKRTQKVLWLEMFYGGSAIYVALADDLKSFEM